MSNANGAFDQADMNRDGQLSESEFRNFIGQNSVGGGDSNNQKMAGGHGSSSFRSSTYEASTGDAGSGGNLTYNSAGFRGAGSGGNPTYNSAGLGGAGYGSSSSYEASSYRSSTGNLGGDSGNLNAAGSTGSYAADAASQSTSAQQYERDTEGNFKDPNPQIIRRPAQNGPVTYSQNIRVRFLQPPAVQPPGPLIIKEVRPPQPPAPAPLRVRQQAPPIPQPPPLILRERPPPIPAAVASQTVVRNLAAAAVPPRSVVIERIPAPPPKPRDIVIERWVPYGAMAKRKTIVQRAEAAKSYPKPQNVVIQYEQSQVRVVRQFQRLGVTQEDPQAYLQRYGASLLDASALVQQARAAGVVEDISPPAVAGLLAASASEFSSASSTKGGRGSEGGVGVGGGGRSFEGGVGVGGGGRSFEGGVGVGGGGRSFEGGVGVGGGGRSFEGGVGVGGGGRASRSSFFESSSYSATGDDAGRGSSPFESSPGRFNGGGANSAFTAADTDSDGVLSQAEFRNAGF